MAADYIVVPIADAEQAREALGRLYAAANDSPWPIPGNPPLPDHQGETRYYVDPLPNADNTLVALGPKDDLIDTCLGQTVACTGGEITLPSAYESLEDSWFPPPPPPIEGR